MAERRKRTGEMRVQRLVLVDERERPRAVLEVVPVVRDGQLQGTVRTTAARLAFLGGRGRPALTIQVDAQGGARIVVGDENGTAVEIDQAGLLIWGGSGNTVVAVRGQDRGGVLEISDAEGRTRVRLPKGR